MLSLVGHVVAVLTVELCPCDPKAALVNPEAQAQLEAGMTAQASNLSTQDPEDYEFEANLGSIVRHCLQKTWLYPYKTLFTRTVVGQTWTQSFVLLERWPHPPLASRRKSIALWVPTMAARWGGGRERCLAN